MRELTFNEVKKVGGAGIPLLGVNFGQPSIPAQPPQSGRMSSAMQWMILDRIFYNKSLDEIRIMIDNGKIGAGPWPGFTILNP